MPSSYNVIVLILINQVSTIGVILIDSNASFCIVHAKPFTDLVHSVLDCEKQIPIDLFAKNIEKTKKRLQKRSSKGDIGFYQCVNESHVYITP